MEQPNQIEYGAIKMSYFPPPPTMKAEVFAKLPGHLRRSATSYWNINNRGQTVDCFLEGPSFDRKGNLYTVDISNGRVYRISPTGDWSVVTEYDGAPCGLKIHQDGRIFIADHRNGIMNLDPDNGNVTPFLSRGPEGFKGINDLFFAANGDMYFTDQGQSGLQDPSGRVYRYSADGKLACLLNNVPSPNGLVVNPEMTVLYVAATRSNQIWQVPLHESGMSLKVGAFANLHGGPAGPDGLALDVEGGLIVAHAGVGIVWRLSPIAQPLLRVESPTGLYTTNIAFGGPDRKDLYITESSSGTILRATLPIAGQLMYSHTSSA